MHKEKNMENIIKDLSTKIKANLTSKQREKLRKDLDKTIEVIETVENAGLKFTELTTGD